MTIPTIPLDKVSTEDEDLANIGEKFTTADGKTYKLVKASANIASAAKKAVVYSNTALTQVAATDTADSGKVAGVIPSDIETISSTSGQIDSGDVFWIQTEGPATVLGAAAIAADAAVGTSTTSGKVDDASITLKGMMGVAYAAIVEAGDVTVILKGLP